MGGRSGAKRGMGGGGWGGEGTEEQLVLEQGVKGYEDFTSPRKILQEKRTVVGKGME